MSLLNSLNACQLGRIAAAMSIIFSMGAQAAPSPKPIEFSYKNWNLSCDNTLTCRAAGYTDDDNQPTASVLLTRQAGPSTPILNKVQLVDMTGEPPSTKPSRPQLIINNKVIGTLIPNNDEEWQMSVEQLNAFLYALHHNAPISFRNNINHYNFSGAGSSAVLLRMDAEQGRVGTPSALIKKGNRSETVVKPAIPAPVINKTTVLNKASRKMSPQEDAAIKPFLMKYIKKLDVSCDQISEPWQVARLNQNQTLVIVPCWMAAYNSGDLYFVIDNKLSKPPVLVSDSANDYDNGVVTSFLKGRGLGDCWSNTEWIWSHNRFIKSEEMGRSPCRMDSWVTPSFTSRVISR